MLQLVQQDQEALAEEEEDQEQLVPPDLVKALVEQDLEQHNHKALVGVQVWPEEELDWEQEEVEPHLALELEEVLVPAWEQAEALD